MKIQNNLTKGINQDIRPRFQPEGTYRHARNKKKSSKKYYSGGLVNELQNKFAASISGKIVGYHRLEERNSTLFFHTDGGSVISIYNHNTDEVTQVVKDSDFGCTWNFQECKWIGYGHSDSKTIAPCNDLIIYWSSGRTYYKANIDELLDPDRRRSITLLEDPCEYFKLFKKSSGPRLRIRVNKGGGRDLPPGQYFTVARLLDESGNTSNWGMIQGPAFLKGKFNKPTDFSRESLRIEAKGLSGNFSRIQIAVIPPVGSQEQDVAYVIYDGSYNTNGVTAEYYSANQHKSIVPLAEILQKDIKFIRGENLLIHDGKLHLYRTVQEFNPKVQKWAQQAVFSAISYAVPVSRAHRYRSLTRDEVAAFGIGWQFIDKTWTAVGHSPGPAAGANDLNCGQCDLPLGHTSNNAVLLETYNTITGSKEVNCYTGGRQTTIRELESDPLVHNCTEQGLTNRSEVGDDCVDQTTQREALQDKIEDIDTRASSLNDCIDCASATTTHDLGVIEGGFVNNLEQVTDLFKTDQEVADNCATGDHSNIPDAAETLYEEAVERAEDDEEITFRTVIKKSGGSTTRIQGQNGDILVFGTNKGDDCVTEDDEPIILGKYRFGGWESSLTYPKTLDCDGEPLYGDLAGLPIRHHKVPDASLIPPFISFQNGVESKYEPANIPGKDTYVVLIGLMVENVYIPSYEAGEIPKPLDEQTPYGVFMAKREKHNQSVLCRAYVTPTFKGLIGNKEYAVPRHALCSYAAVDRSIDNEDSHLGEDWEEFIYNAHSPDVASTADFFNADYVVVNGIISGDGRVYGLYDEGKDVPEEEHRLDRRGARGAINLTDWQSVNFKTCLKGADFAEFNTNLSAPTGIDYPLLNKYRESSIYFQTNEALPGLTKDHSFNVGGLNHEYPTQGNSLYVTFKRFNSQQYGSIESLQYIHTGLEGKGTETSVRGTAGDSFVQKWSHKRTSYVSDKVGNYLNDDLEIIAVAPRIITEEFLGSGEVRKRGVCDPPNRRGYRMREFLGFFNASQLPEDGDKKEPKNMANGHPTKYALQIQTELAEGTITNAETDLYYPRTLSHLNHLCIESDVNLYYRSTNIAETREVFYEELQGLDVDSSINQVDPNEAWLNDWHNEQKQPTRKQMNKKAMIRFLLVVVGPLIAAGGFAGISTALEAGATALASPFIGIIWMTLTYNILSGRKLDQFLGLPPCKMDDEGAQGENNTKGLKDNWVDYNWGFSAVNDQNILIGMPQPYNTCVCDELTNVIYTSNRQIDTSPYDAFANFQALSFFGLSGDAGQLQRMFSFSGRAYAQTTDAMYALRDKQTSSPYGDGGFEISPIPFQDGAYEGFFGTEDPNASIITKYGYISVDYEANDITQFNGSIKSLVDRKSGLYRYWKNNTKFCNTGSRDAMCSGGVHYAFGYDPEYELLLITKHDGSGGHTWSYDLESQSYVSEHDFIPDFYFWDREKMFMVKDSNIYRANMEGAYSTYFGKAYPSSVDITVRSNTGDQFTFINGILDTEVTKGDLLDRNETYSNVTIWGDFVSTGNLEIRTEEENSTDASQEDFLKVSRRELGKWKFNTIRANEINRDTPVAISGVCGGRDELNSQNITNDNPVHTAKQFSSKFMNFRFEFNKNDREIAILGLDTHITQSNEG